MLVAHKLTENSPRRAFFYFENALYSNNDDCLYLFQYTRQQTEEVAFICSSNFETVYFNAGKPRERARNSLRAFFGRDQNDYLDIIQKGVYNKRTVDVRLRFPEGIYAGNKLIPFSDIYVCQSFSPEKLLEFKRLDLILAQTVASGQKTIVDSGVFVRLLACQKSALYKKLIKETDDDLGRESNLLPFVLLQCADRKLHFYPHTIPIYTSLNLSHLRKKEFDCNIIELDFNSQVVKTFLKVITSRHLYAKIEEDPYLTKD